MSQDRAPPRAAPWSDGRPEPQRTRTPQANSGTFRSYTVRFTWFYDYYDQTGDPCTQWGLDPNFSGAVGSLSGFPGARVPYNPQRK